MLRVLAPLLAFTALASAAPCLSLCPEETRSLSELYQDALTEGGVLNVRAGGDELDQQDSIKQAWESAFPGIKYNVTIDLSKYHDGYIDREIASGQVYTDVATLQTLHDFPRWKDAGALMQYKPAGFGQVFDEIKDSDGYYYGCNLFGWALLYNTAHVTPAPTGFIDLLRPELKDKLVMTYPNDDDSFQHTLFNLVNHYGYDFFDKLIAQNPRWVRGGSTPIALMSTSLNGNGSYYLAYTAAFGPPGLAVVDPTDVPATTWSQTAAILAKAPHPKTAKLFANFLLSKDFQAANSPSVRKDVPPANGDKPANEKFDLTAFAKYMADRPSVERFRFFIESKIGTPQGLSPLVDGL
ncbi:hypothetical protein DFJ73DRAFT_954791 [Zopfochytrium polystomum]|nr:hypothetical protein DFJ73DRAFT_954791 [Zopfochytrium polystomum]